MTTKPEPRRRRGTPISDSLDDYLQRQAGRIEEPQGHLLSESAEILLSPGQDLDTLTAGELQNICRQQRLRGWSRLRRSDLDLLVEFQTIDPGALVAAYFGLERQLAAITGQPVDLVMADALSNPYVRADIDASKPLIYEA